MSITDLQADQQPLEVANLITRMIEVKEALLKKTPNLPNALVDIHKNLMLHEELIHLMDDEDIAALHQAHEFHKQIAIVVKEEKVAKKRSTKKLSDNDLSNL